MLPPERSLGPIEAWRSAADWLACLAAALTTDDGDRIRRASSVAVDTLLAIASMEAAHADADTGRRSAVSANTIAAELGIERRTVGRARKIMEALGAMVTVARGRYLHADERAKHPGQIKAASTRTLTYPHGFRRGAGERPEPRRMSINVSNRRSRRISPIKVVPKAERKPNPRRVQVARLVQRMPWMPVNPLIGMLDRLMVPVHVTADRILDAIERANRALGRTVPDPAVQRDPVGVLRWMLEPVIAELAAAPPPRTPNPATQCPPHRFDPVSGWCVKCGRVRER